MIRVYTSTEPLVGNKSKCYGIIVPEYKGVCEEISKLEQTFVPGLRQLIADSNFSGMAGEKFVLPVITELGVVHLICVGMGSGDKDGSMERYRRALGVVVKEVARLKANTLALLVPPASYVNSSDSYLAEQTVVIADMAYYHFDDFLTENKKLCSQELALTFVLSSHDSTSIQKGITKGLAVAHGVYFTRRWVDMPPDHSTPTLLVEKAQEIARAHGFVCTIFNEKEVNQMGMGGLSAVSRGSERDCHLVILEYKTSKPGMPTIGLVGKGITFDSGGLSIKPADSMETMKSDMAGAAAVLGAMDVLGTMRPDVNVIAVLPLAENLPSGKAIKPGDIVTFYNGKTAEILNTDAEGRLILADALSYAVKHYTLDALIDVATLTGACSVALGHFYAALLSKHDLVVDAIKRASDSTGERVWRMPLDDDFKPAIRSEYADIKNIGSKKYSAGTITAAFFLHNFVADVPWAHLDIAGTAFDIPDISYYRSGATGFGVRLLVELVMNW